MYNKIAFVPTAVFHAKIGSSKQIKVRRFFPSNCQVKITTPKVQPTPWQGVYINTQTNRGIEQHTAESFSWAKKLTVPSRRLVNLVIMGVHLKGGFVKEDLLCNYNIVRLSHISVRLSIGRQSAAPPSHPLLPPPPRLPLLAAGGRRGVGQQAAVMAKW